MVLAPVRLSLFQVLGPCFPEGDFSGLCCCGYCLLLGFSHSLRLLLLLQDFTHAAAFGLGCDVLHCHCFSGFDGCSYGVARSGRGVLVDVPRCWVIGADGEALACGALAVAPVKDDALLAVAGL